MTQFKKVLSLFILEVLVFISCNGQVVQPEESRLGEYSPIDVNSVAAQKASQIALAYLNDQYNSDHLMMVVNVTSAEQQVESGTKIRITMKVGVSSCQKSDSNSSEGCVLNRDQPIGICRVEVYDQPWTNTQEVIGFVCTGLGKDQQRRK